MIETDETYGETREAGYDPFVRARHVMWLAFLLLVAVLGFLGYVIARYLWDYFTT